VPPLETIGEFKLHSVSICIPSNKYLTTDFYPLSHKFLLSHGTVINLFVLRVFIAGRIIIFTRVPAPNGDRYMEGLLLIGTPVTYLVT
jgi:hypothetical protein